MNRLTQYLTIPELLQTPVTTTVTGVVAPTQAQAVVDGGVTRFNPAQLGLSPKMLRKLIRAEVARIKDSLVVMSADDPARDYLQHRRQQLHRLFAWSKECGDELTLGVFPSVEAVRD